MLVSFRRIVRAGWTAFSRSSLLNIATIFVLVITISLVTSLFFLNKSVNYLSDFIRDRVDISVYFNEDVSEEDVLALKQEIEQLPEVKDVKYVSKEKALREFSEKYKHNKDIMESLNVVGSNPLLVSLNVRSWEADQYSNISNFLINSKLKDSINEIDYQQKEPIIQKLFSVTSSINKFG
ncbi:MAG: permease-like cell division protein FtsX, partial [Patescibacteria group bacterium]|nr:permease-like cell division protein FtsX [Patescibacteria group bacterium]